jgi:8-amino-7-oxononanoate synthase
MDRLARRVGGRLGAIRDANQLRALRPPAGVDLSSNDYLGLAADPRVKQALMSAVSREGCGSTGSRLLRGDRQAFTDLERRFADFKGTERALYFSSGYLANLAVLTTLPERGDLILSDDRNHASLIDAIRLSAADHLVVPHNDLDAVRRQLELREAGNAGLREVEGEIFVVTESLFSMDGDVAPLAELASLCASHGATLIVDEAHAVGVCGARGTGLIEALGVDAGACISINTAGKALGAAGAFVAGPAWAIDYLIQRARPFIFSTAPLPAIAAAIEASLDIVSAEPERRHTVADLARDCRARLASAGLSVAAGSSHIIPIVLGDNERALAAAEALQAQGFDVRAIRPPSVAPGTARLRVSINARLDHDIIRRFVAALARALENVHPWSAVSS